MTVDVASWRGILVPLDGSVEALRAVPIAAGVEARTGLPMSLITGVCMSTYGRGRVARSAVFARRVADAIIDELRSLPTVGALTTDRRSDVTRLKLGEVGRRVMLRGPTPLLLAPEHK